MSLEWLSRPILRQGTRLISTGTAFVIRLASGSFVDEALQHTHTDLLYAVQTKQGEQALVYVLFQHQSTFYPTVAYRILRYLVRVWERWLRDHPETHRLPIVLPGVALALRRHRRASAAAENRCGDGCQHEPPDHGLSL